MSRKVIIIGLDCAEPSLAFEAYAHEMPNLRSLRSAGCWGPLRSTLPPITVPAWTSMVSGYDPGELGLYGFRDRRPGTYAYDYASSLSVRVPRLWDILGGHGRRSLVFAVPPTYPPPSEMSGALVSCFLTPDAGRGFTFPPTLREELHRRFGPYIVDVEDFRTDDKPALLQRIRRMTDQHFRMAQWMMKTLPWDLFMMVDMGLDRFHHGFWKYIDPRHPKYLRGNPFEGEGAAYYGMLDAWIGRLVDEAPRDSAVIIVSDHGAKRLLGGVGVNEWLLREGYLKLRGRAPSAATPLSDLEIDWKRTRAWGEGGYCGRIHLNVRGREPQGIVEQGRDRETLLEEIAKALAGMKDASGRVIGTRALRAGDIYRSVQGHPPDLLVLLGNLDYRGVGSVGLGGVLTHETDMGPDDANHDFDGILVMSGDGVPASGRIQGAAIYDIAPTVCKWLDVPYNEPTMANVLL